MPQNLTDSISCLTRVITYLVSPLRGARVSRFISRVMLQASGGGGGVNPLGLSNVAGVFLVTLAGCGMATIFAVIEFLYGTRKAAMEAGVSWLEEMSTELKFIFTCHGNTKKVG